MGESTRRLATALVTAFLMTTGLVASQAVAAPGGMSSAAAKVLHRIVEARAAIHAGNPASAERDLYKALTLIANIKAMRPTTCIADHTWVAEKHLDYEEPDEVALDLIPIEVCLADLEDVVRVQSAQRHLEETRGHLKRGDAEAARQAIQRLRESLAQTEIDLPLNSTEQHIRMALASLSEDTPTEAEAALKKAEAGVRFVSLGPSTPLAKARRALWQATENHAAGHHKAVQADLVRALIWLDRVKTGTDANVDREAERLRVEINELIQREAYKKPGAAQILAGYWHRAVGLMQHEAEKLYHQWHSQENEDHLFRLLTDAKLHLFYAEHGLFNSADAEDARQELDAAATYLRAAAQQATSPRKTRIAALEEKVVALGPLAARPDETARSRYDQTLAELRQMIEGM